MYCLSIPCRYLTFYSRPTICRNPHCTVCPLSVRTLNFILCPLFFTKSNSKLCFVFQYLIFHSTTTVHLISLCSRSSACQYLKIYTLPLPVSTSNFTFCPLSVSTSYCTHYLMSLSTSHCTLCALSVSISQWYNLSTVSITHALYSDYCPSVIRNL